MPIVEGRQYRTMQPIQPMQADKLIDSECYVDGYAMTYERYKLWDDDEGGVWEQFMPNCFDECDMSDVIMQYDHNGRVFARNSNGTLKLVVDSKGLRIGADLSKTSEARSLYEDISAGMITKMSWTFMPLDGRYRYDHNSRTIIHYGVKKIYDVSAVSIPANDGTEIYTRNFCDGEIKRVKQELLAAEKRRLNLKLKLEGF